MESPSLLPASVEVAAKLALVRAALDAGGLGAVRLRGVDFFAWATAGGSSAVLHTAETGIADVLVTPTDALVLTDRIEAERLAAEEVPAPFAVWATAWQSPEKREAFVREVALGRPVASDRPAPDERPLPDAVVAAKRRLMPAEIPRYEALGRDAAEAATEALAAARPAWSEYDLAAAGAMALWRRGVHPALVLAAGADRLGRYRHPIPTAAPLGRRAMLVFCARRHGLFANLTRFVVFGPPDAADAARDEAICEVEAEALGATRPGAALSEIYRRIAAAYARAGFAGEEFRHHQGGTTGYRSREVVASPATDTVVEASTAVAWNPSLPGTKVEDSFVLRASGPLLNLTADPAWPTIQQDGRARPIPLVRP